jgi:hypothetical protein
MSYAKLVTAESSQVSHFDRVDAITKNDKIYIDVSKPGLGKTFPPIHLCQKYNLSLFVVAPKSITDMWENKAKEYGITVECIITYESLRGFKNRALNHPYLQRIDSVHNAGSESVEYKVTDRLIKVIEKGCMFVLDEFQKLKNRSAQWKASKTITIAIDEIKSESRCGLLSGSAFDKPEHARQVLELTCILKSRFMFRTNAHTGLLDYMSHGLGEVITKSASYDEATTLKILEKHQLSTINNRRMETVAEKVCYELLAEVILKHKGSMMFESKSRNLKNSKLVTIGTECGWNSDIMNIIANYLIEEDKKNGYFTVCPETEQKISEKVGQYARMMGFNPDNDDIDLKRLGHCVQITEQLETLKLEIFERVSKQRLEDNPNCKGVIFLNFIDNIKELGKKLKDYNPTLFYGATKNRGAVIEDFMKNPESRVFIANITVGGVGIELDDQVGDAPRFCLVSPSYRVIDMYQAMLRVFRKNTKSDVWIRLVYGNIRLGKHIIKESRIINAIIKKSEVLKSISSPTEIYPGNFEDEYEPYL